MFERIKQIWKGIISMFTSTSIKKIVNGPVELTSSMVDAIDLWNKMYNGSAPWCEKYVSSLGIEEGICREFANVATTEMNVVISNEVLNKLYKDSTMALSENLQEGLALGSFIMRPLGDTAEFITADKFIPIKFDSSGNLLDCAIVEQKIVDNTNVYTRVERHSIISGFLTISNKAYKSNSTMSIGTPVPLSAQEQWKGLPEEVSYPGMVQMDLGYYRNPIVNRIDGSFSGVSIYHKASERIKRADEQGARIDWEFKSGERVIHVDERALKKGRMGKLDERLYQGLDLEAGEHTELLKEYSPEFRETNIINGLEEYYRQIEFIVGLAYGDLSNPQMVEKTATEVLAAKQRKYNRVNAIEDNLKKCLHGYIDALAFYNELYTSGYEVNILFEDSILADKEAERATDREEVAMGAMSMVEYRMKWYGEDEETAKKNLPEQSNVMV